MHENDGTCPRSLVTKKVKKAILARIKTSRETIAAERDKLRDTISELEDICSDSDDAIEHIDSAVTVLSQYL